MLHPAAEFQAIPWPWGDIMRSRMLSLAAGLTTLLAGLAPAAPHPPASTHASVDLGAAQTHTQITVTVAMKLRNEADLQSRLQATYTPGHPLYHHFLATGEFAAAYGPDAATVAKLTQRFASQGLSVSRVSTTLLQLTGSARAIQA